MPFYELYKIIRTDLPKSELSGLLYKCASVVLQNHGNVRSIQHLGVKQLPYHMKNQTKLYWEGRYTVLQFDASPRLASLLRDKLRYDNRLIRMRLVRRPKSDQFGLTALPTEN